MFWNNIVNCHKELNSPESLGRPLGRCSFVKAETMKVSVSLAKKATLDFPPSRIVNSLCIFFLLLGDSGVKGKAKADERRDCTERSGNDKCLFLLYLDQVVHENHDCGLSTTLMCMRSHAL